MTEIPAVVEFLMIVAIAALTAALIIAHAKRRKYKAKVDAYVSGNEYPDKVITNAEYRNELKIAANKLEIKGLKEREQQYQSAFIGLSKLAPNLYALLSKEFIRYSSSWEDIVERKWNYELITRLAQSIDDNEYEVRKALKKGEF